MGDSDARILLVTANVGSIFEDPEVLLKSWVKEFLKSVEELRPKFIALHCQEVGGKNYEDSMKHVDSFVRTLLESAELNEFSHVKIFLDEDFTSTEKFTALGNLYFIHGSIEDCQIWDFQASTFIPVIDQDIYSGNIENVTLKEKDKFPKDFFPECKWSRKGFMRTRWNVDGVVFDLINIHLFHDASNFVAMEEFPSAYTRTRQHALEYTLDRLEAEEGGKIPFFLFGDFNFRLNTGAVIKKLTDGSEPKCLSCPKGETEKMVYKSDSDEEVLTVEKKVFDLTETGASIFYESENRQWLLELDNERQLFAARLHEFAITFPPSYPFTEDDCGTTYMKTRCPSWCDRIFFNAAAKSICRPVDSDDDDVLYRMMGRNVPMGDHKPIILYFQLQTGRKGLDEVRLGTRVEGSQSSLAINVLTQEPTRNMSSNSQSFDRSAPRDLTQSNSRNTSNSTEAEKTTRYIYVEYNDRVTVFRETTV